MKKLLYLCLALLVAAGATAQQQRKKVYIAVIGKMDDPIVGKALADKVEHAYTKSPYYTPVTRTPAILAELNREIEFQQSDEVLTSHIIKLGEKYGAAYVCIIEVDFSPRLRRYNIAGKLIDIKTTEVAHSAEPFLSSLDEDKEEVTNAANSLATALGRKTDKEIDDERQKQLAAAMQQQAEANRKAEADRKAAEAEQKKKDDMAKAGYALYGKFFVELEPSTRTMTWSEAQNRCNRLTKGGYKWQLLSVGELSQLYRDGYSFDNVLVWSRDVCDKSDSKHTIFGRGNQKECYKDNDKYAKEKVKCLCIRSK
jgi:hypothetical protein